MNTPNNKRRKDSQRRIESAFIKLLQTQDLTQISVTDICKSAQVNRTTFYANYADIYALAEAVQKNLEKEVFEFFRDNATAQNQHDFLTLFYHIKENQLLYKTYFKLSSGASPLSFGYNLQEAISYLDNQYIDYHLEFFASGLTALIKKWLERDCKETPEEIYSILEIEYHNRAKLL